MHVVQRTKIGSAVGHWIYHSYNLLQPKLLSIFSTLTFAYNGADDIIYRNRSKWIPVPVKCIAADGDTKDECINLTNRNDLHVPHGDVTTLAPRCMGISHNLTEHVVSMVCVEFNSIIIPLYPA